MVQMGTKRKVVDNSGVREVRCIRILEGRRTRTYERQKGTVPGGTKRARVRMGEEVRIKKLVFIL